MVGSVLKKKFSKNAQEGRDFFNVTEVNPRGGERFEKKVFKKSANVPENGYFPGMFGSWNSGPLTGPWLISGWRRMAAQPRAESATRQRCAGGFFLSLPIRESVIITSITQ